MASFQKYPGTLRDSVHNIHTHLNLDEEYFNNNGSLKINFPLNMFI